MNFTTELRERVAHALITVVIDFVCEHVCVCVFMMVVYVLLCVFVCMRSGASERVWYGLALLACPYTRAWSDAYVCFVSVLC